MVLTKKHVGQINLRAGTVDVTAPYHKVGSRFRHVLEVLPGKYDCYIFEGKTDRDWKIRPWIARIVTADRRMAPVADRKILTGRNWRKITAVGVSDCLTGFFDRKPEFTDEEMAELCKIVADQSSFVYNRDSYVSNWENPLYGWFQDAFLIQNRSCNGQAFQVYAIKQNDVCIALEIRLLAPWRESRC